MLFDEAYFMYHEDIDWSKGLLSAGHTLGVIPKAKAFHLEGGSTNSRGGLSLQGICMRWNSLRLYLSKHGRAPGYNFLSLFWFVSRMSYVYAKRLFKY